MPELVNVPDVDGVPAMLFAAGSGGDILLAAADAIGIPLPTAGSQQWGFFLNGAQVVKSDNVVAFDFKRDFVISDYPQEKGSFESYNKVQIPFDVRFVFTAGGSESDRANLLASIEAVVGDLNLYEGVTPEKAYRNLNLVHYDVRRTAQNGNKLLIVSVGAQEVRQVTSASGAGMDPSATGSVGDTATASGADQTNTGTVQATDATAAQSSSVGDQAFAGGYNVGGYNAGGSGPLGNGSFSTGTDFGNVSGVESPIEVSVGELTVQDGVTGQVLMAPTTTSNISGLQAAGPDQYNLFGGGP
jgi:hypothetical protein